MAYVKNNNSIEVGEWVVTNRMVGNYAGYFENGTRVKVIGLSERGYALMDEHGNIIIETGWDSIRKIK